MNRESKRISRIASGEKLDYIREAIEKITEQRIIAAVTTMKSHEEVNRLLSMFSLFRRHVVNETRHPRTLKSMQHPTIKSLARPTICSHPSSPVFSHCTNYWIPIQRSQIANTFTRTINPSAISSTTPCLAPCLSCQICSDHSQKARNYWWARSDHFLIIWTSVWKNVLR